MMPDNPLTDLMQWEIDWILKNPNRYDSNLHALSVINNIKRHYAKMYHIRLIKLYERTKDDTYLTLLFAEINSCGL